MKNREISMFHVLTLIALYVVIAATVSIILLVVALLVSVLPQPDTGAVVLATIGMACALAIVLTARDL